MISLISLLLLKECGQVSEIVVPSLQHWIFTEDLVGHFPDARLLFAPPACGEDLAHKMPGLAGRAERLVNGASQLGSDLEVRSHIHPKIIKDNLRSAKIFSK